jgi:hypothetical protein
LLELEKFITWMTQENMIYLPKSEAQTQAP